MNNITLQSKKLMIGLSLGHGIKHFGQGALLIMSPSIRTSLKISELALGAIFTIQQMASVLTNIPAGIMADMFRRHIPRLLATSMLLVSIGYMLVGFSNWYFLTLVAVVAIGSGTSMWHAPAFGTLASLYPNQKGLAMSAHLTGAQIGNTMSPIIIGFLLGGTLFNLQFKGIPWNFLSMSLAVPMSLTGLIVLLKFKQSSKQNQNNLKLQEYLDLSKRLISNKIVLAMILLGAMRGAIHQSFAVFIVLHMREVLAYSHFVVGLHLSLLTMAGIISTPLMGHVSDKVGRKPVITTAMSLMSLVLFAFLYVDSGLLLTLLIGILGLFIFSVMPIITAAAMDQVESGTEGSITALIFTGSGIVAAISPMIAGAIYGEYQFHGVVIMTGIIAFISALLSFVLPMTSPNNKTEK